MENNRGIPDVKKCIIIIAPHTSNWDLIIGKLYMNEKGVNNSVLVKKELFFFPMNIIMRAIGTVPIDRKNRKILLLLRWLDILNRTRNFV